MITKDASKAHIASAHKMIQIYGILFYKQPVAKTVSI